MDQWPPPVSTGIGDPDKFVIRLTYHGFYVPVIGGPWAAGGLHPCERVEPVGAGQPYRRGSVALAAPDTGSYALRADVDSNTTIGSVNWSFR